jgi:hypothetical protein
VTKKERAGVQLAIGIMATALPDSNERNAGINWLMKQTALDDRRRKSRGRYKKR